MPRPKKAPEANAEADTPVDTPADTPTAEAAAPVMSANARSEAKMQRQSLEDRQLLMIERQKAYNREAVQRSRLKKQIARLSGPDANVRVEIIHEGHKPKLDVTDLVARLEEALGTMKGLSPEEIHEKVSTLTNVIHIKLQLHVSKCLDALAGHDPDVSKYSLQLIETLMPYITQITELNVKMQVALGLGESKVKLLGPAARQNTVLPAPTAQSWESQYGNTLTDRNLN